jgi:CBS domain-containing protein
MAMDDQFAFLRNIPPFNLLPEEVIQGTASLLHRVEHTKESIIYHQESTKMRGIDIIAEGEYESFFYDSAQHKKVVEYHHRGFCYGGMSILLNKKKSLKTVIAKKGTVVYFLHRQQFRELCNVYQPFFHYFTSLFGNRMQDEEFAHFFKRPTAFEESYIASEQLYSRRIESIEQRAIVWCYEDEPVYRAAQLMAASRVSCLFVKSRDHRIVGYLTDITIRDKVVGAQQDVRGAVSTYMDNPVLSVKAEAYIYEAILQMFRTKARYLLVEQQGAYVGFLSRNKLLSEQAQSPMVYIQSVKSANSDDELKRKWDDVPQMVNQLLQRGVNAEIINQVITTIADTIAVKVIESVIQEIGKPPARFVFMVLGSEGRKEQTLKTDQDNAIIYEDKANEQRELVRDYFLDFATRVSDKLNHIGFVYCSGGFMAKNPQWTHSLSHWKRSYQSWMQESLPETVINFSTFFDCRYLYGDESILQELKTFLDEELQKPMEKLFFFMAKNALQYEPPLKGFFKSIRTITIGDQEVFDIKKAMTPIVDLVRVYALKNRVFEVNTGERMKALQLRGVFTGTELQELLQSYYFLMSMRLKSQARQIMTDNNVPGNYIELKSLTKIDQLTLKEVFKTIENFQVKIRQGFTNSLF